jgi:hypothetical protein
MVMGRVWARDKANVIIRVSVTVLARSGSSLVLGLVLGLCLGLEYGCSFYQGKGYNWG